MVGMVTYGTAGYHEAEPQNSEKTGKKASHFINRIFFRQQVWGETQERPMRDSYGFLLQNLTLIGIKRIRKF